jgi:hypothetical protein
MGAAIRRNGLRAEDDARTSISKARGRKTAKSYQSRKSASRPFVLLARPVAKK